MSIPTLLFKDSMFRIVASLRIHHWIRQEQNWPQKRLRKETFFWVYTTLSLLGPSVNLPKICPNASWSVNGITFANSSFVGSYPYGLFVDTSNNIYVAETSLNQVQVWSQGSATPTRTLFGGLDSPHSVWATSNGDIYVDNGFNGTVVKWTLNAVNSVTAMIVTGRCMDLFIDTSDTLYCSLDSWNTVLAVSLNSDPNMTRIVAGDGSAGSGPSSISVPNGIFVDLSFNLFVADFSNDRVQKFVYGQLNGTTVVGSGAPGTISLSGPTGAAADANGYLYIADYNNNRIVGSGPNGFRCVIGCSGSNGPASNQLYEPQDLSFDSYGNIYVADSGNDRIQVFTITNNLCTASSWSLLKDDQNPNLLCAYKSVLKFTLPSPKYCFFLNDDKIELVLTVFVLSTPPPPNVRAIIFDDIFTISQSLVGPMHEVSSVQSSNYHPI